MFDPKPARAAVAGGQAPRMFARTAGAAPALAAVRGMSDKARVAACCPPGAPKLPTAIGPDANQTLLPGVTVTLTFTPYQQMEGLRFWLSPEIAMNADVRFIGNQGCNNQAGAESVPGEVYARTNEGDYGCAITRIRCVSSDRPLEVQLTGRAGVPALGLPINAAMIGYNCATPCSDVSVQGNRVMGCYDAQNVPTRESVLGSTAVTLTDAAPTASLVFTPYASFEGTRLFLPEAYGVNVRVTRIEHVGCNLLASAGQVSGQMFAGSSSSDFCYPLILTGCIDSTQPLIVEVTKYQGPAEISFKGALIGFDKRAVACG